MSPAAFHRIVENGYSSERLHAFSSYMILLSMLLLAFGTAGDFYIIAYKITHLASFAITATLLLLVFILCLWFGLTYYLREQKSTAK
jgi:hypothetical protein